MKSNASTQRELIDKTSNELISLSLEEMHEVLNCSRRITEIFQNALVRNDHDCGNSNVGTSCYSEPFSRQVRFLFVSDHFRLNIFTIIAISEIWQQRIIHSRKFDTCFLILSLIIHLIRRISKGTLKCKTFQQNDDFLGKN